jgi:hypothetical protein
MDERLEKALDFSNYMVTLTNQKRLLKEKYHEELLYFYKGSQFTVSSELMTFVNMLVDKGNDTVVLVDDNDTPALIDDLTEFYDNILDVYFGASNSYHTQYEQLKKNRSPAKLVNYDQD